jgi:hypothetical protein
MMSGCVHDSALRICALCDAASDMASSRCERCAGSGALSGSGSGSGSGPLA